MPNAEYEMDIGYYSDMDKMHREHYGYSLYDDLEDDYSDEYDEPDRCEADLVSDPCDRVCNHILNDDGTCPNAVNHW